MSENITSDDLFKKLRASLSMRKNVALTQLIEECNSDWDINVYEICARWAGRKRMGSILDVLDWLNNFEDVSIRNSNNGDYVINFEFGDEFADIQRYIAVSKPKKKRVNRNSKSFSMKGMSLWKDGNTNFRRYNSDRRNDRFNIENGQSYNSVRNSMASAGRMFHENGLNLLKNTLNNTMYMNKRHERMKQHLRDQHELVKEMVKVDINGDSECNRRRMKSFNSDTQHSDTKSQEIKSNKENEEVNHHNRTQRRPVPKYVCGSDAIEALLSRHKKLVVKSEEEEDVENKKTTNTIMENKIDVVEDKNVPKGTITEAVKYIDKSLDKVKIPNDKVNSQLNNNSLMEINDFVKRESVFDPKESHSNNNRFKRNNNMRYPSFESTFSSNKMEKRSKFIYNFPKPAVV
uniref:DUF4777 domain-containing protein n=1 Tax=Parastrongyloides trichosuri TaxID=131310 RepID=A0A0N5A1A5_PARTI